MIVTKLKDLDHKIRGIITSAEIDKCLFLYISSNKNYEYVCLILHQKHMPMSEACSASRCRNEFILK